MDTDVIIRVEHMTAAYDDTVLLDDISFEVRPGEIFVIMGGSGCGKSTLMKHMIGLYSPAAGSVRIRGRNITTAEGNERQKILSGLGVMYQGGALFGSLTLLENVRLPLEEFTALPPDALDGIAAMKLKLVGLGGALHQAPAEISGGMQKRAAIARAMALDPPVLFLDEPSAGLDPITSAELDRLIQQLARYLGITFVIVSHELSSIDAIADRVIMLDARAKGIVATGKPATLRAESENPWVRQFFNRQPPPDTV